MLPEEQKVLSWVPGSWLRREVPLRAVVFHCLEKHHFYFIISNERTLPVTLMDKADFTRGSQFGSGPTCAGSPSSLNASCSLDPQGRYTVQN